jgi:CTP synthase (UTP-ammonia lyase)
MSSIKVGIIADYNPKNKYHLATEDSLRHAASALGIELQTEWLDTDQLERSDADERFRSCDALYCGPGSPYRSMDGALRGIRFAREHRYPFIGT